MYTAKATDSGDNGGNYCDREKEEQEKDKEEETKEKEGKLLPKNKIKQRETQRGGG